MFPFADKLEFFQHGRISWYISYHKILKQIYTIHRFYVTFNILTRVASTLLRTIFKNSVNTSKETQH